MPSLLMQAPLTDRPESRPTFPRRRMRYPVVCARNPLAQDRPTAEKRALRVLFLDFPLVFECLESDGFLPVRARIGRGLSAKQMPLNDPRQVEEMYPAMSSASPIGFQGKSDAVATLLLRLPLLSLLQWISYFSGMGKTRNDNESIANVYV